MNRIASLPPTEQLLLVGGDARIALDPSLGANKYGCPPAPDPGLLDFASSTASVISKAGFAAADALRLRLLDAHGEEPGVVYARELERVRRELLAGCGLAATPGVDVVFAASGTDLHLIAAQLSTGSASASTLVVMVEAAETGSSVPAALEGRHFSSCSALGGPVVEGAAIAGTRALEVVTVPIRHEDGSLRSPDAIDAEVASLVRAQAADRPILLLMVDVSKTGLIAPSPRLVLALQQQRPDAIRVLVDACQFRLSPGTLRAYLAHGFMVALTGSKFLTGPTFSGALLIPKPIAERLQDHPLPMALRGYSSKAEWPQGWPGVETLAPIANFGLLLRWEAALEEWRAFREVPEAVVSRILAGFRRAVEDRLRGDPAFEPLAAPKLDRRPFVDASGWDHAPTIFPFLLVRLGARGERVPLRREETMEVYRLLNADLAPSEASAGAIASVRCQLGQPVACGVRAGVPVSALRLCASARLVVEATRAGSDEAVIARAMAALDKTAHLVTRHTGSRPRGTSRGPGDPDPVPLPLAPRADG